MTTDLKTEGALTLQVPARRVVERIPGMLAVGDTELRTSSEAGKQSGRIELDAAWRKGSSRGGATIAIRPLSKVNTELTVTLRRPSGAQAFLWPKAALRRLERLLAQAMAYEIETRNAEETAGFDVRRTSVELVRARAS